MCLCSINIKKNILHTTIGSIKSFTYKKSILKIKPMAISWFLLIKWNIKKTKNNHLKPSNQYLPLVTIYVWFLIKKKYDHKFKVSKY